MSNSTIDVSNGSMTHTWILDSGANSHIANSLHMFTHYSPLVDRFVILPNKSKIPIMAIGSVSLNQDITLSDVLYIPSFTINLIYVSGLLRSKDCDLKFTSTGFVIQDLHLQRKIGKGEINMAYIIFCSQIL